MGKFDGILLCTDLDGTLFSSDGTLSGENKRAIEYFKDEGGAFTFITGRPPLTAGRAISIAKPNVPIGCFNGGGIFDHTKNEYVFLTELDGMARTLADEVYERIPEVAVHFYTPHKTYFTRVNEASDRYSRITGLDFPRAHYNDISEPIIKMVFASLSGEVIERVRDFLLSHPLSEKFDFIRSEFAFFEMIPRGVDKGQLLYKLADHLGIDRKRTIAAGDYNNDVSMVKAAGVGVAVSNAVDELKAIADIITVSCDEHAIREIVRMLESGELTV